MGQSPPSTTYNTARRGLPFFQGKIDFGERYPVTRIYCSEPQKIAEPGDLLISVRAPVGPTNVALVKSCIGRGLAAVRPGSDVRPDFLLYLLRHAEPGLARLGLGSTFDAIGRADLETFSISLPSCADQCLVAAQLAEADRLRRMRRYALDLSDTFLPAAFLRMFGNPVTNERGWQSGQLGSILDFLTSGSRGWAQHYASEGNLFLRIQNVLHGSLSLSDMTYVKAPSGAEARRTQVQAGDVLLSITADLGRSAPIHESLPTAYVNQHLALLRPRGIDPVFLSASLSSDAARRAWKTLDRDAVKSGLNFDDIRGFRTIFPPLALQQQYASLVAQHERLCAQQREALRQAEYLFHTLLDRAFSKS